MMVNRKEKLVSVIIPSYNCEEYIGKAIDSVLQQSYNNIELIIVNDGSTDRTEDIIKKYSTSIKYISQSNQGVSTARNTGILAADGEYISFLDSDDIWNLETLGLQLGYFVSHPDVGLVYGDMELFDHTGTLSENWLVRAGGPRPEGFIFQELIFQCLFQTSTVMVRREVLDDVGLFDSALPLGEDYDLWLRIAAKYKIGYIPKVLTGYRRRKGSLTASDATLKPWDIAVAEKALEREADEARKISPRVVKKKFGARYFQAGYSALKEGKYSIARYRLRKSILLIPWNHRVIMYLVAAYCFPRLVCFLLGKRKR